jgi:hypothetical protein
MHEHERERQELRELVAEAETLDPEIARRVSERLRYDQSLTFSKLKSIGTPAASCLQSMHSSLSFPSIRDIDHESARILMSGTLRELIFDGIETISLQVAKGFDTGLARGRTTRLFLRGLKSVSPAVAIQLKRCAITTGEVGKIVAAAPLPMTDRVLETVGFIVACFLGLLAFSKGCDSGPPF